MSNQLSQWWYQHQHRKLNELVERTIGIAGKTTTKTAACPGGANDCDSSSTARTSSP